MSKKLTPWFPGDVKPVRVGVYQRDYSDDAFPDVFVYCKWDGKAFHVYGENELSASRRDCPSNNQNMPWRGLAEPPK